MAVRTISTKLAIEGENEYKRSIADINTSLKTLQSELQKVESQYQEDANSVKALQAKKEALLKIQEKEREKVRELSAALDNAKNAQKQHAAAYAEYSAKVAETEKKLFALKDSTKNSAEEQKRLTQELEKYKKAQAEAKSYQDAAARGVEEWQTKLNRSERDLNNLTASIQKNDKALAEATSKFKSFAEATDKASEKLNNAGNKLTAGLTLPLMAAGTAAVSYASDTDEALNKVDVAFGDSADSIKRWSNTTLTSLGLAKGTALDMAALYGDMATAMGFSTENAAEMSKSLVSLAADMASFKNISIETANTALKSVFTGETESLKNLGIVMTETNLSNYALSQGFKETYSQMDQAEKVALRYQYVMAMTENAQGDFARTSDGTANQLRILQESLKEAAATLGSELLPIVTPIIQNLAKLIQSFTDLDEGTRKAVVQMGLFLAALGPTLKLTGGFTSALGSAVKALFSLKAAQAGATAGQLALNAAVKSNGISALISTLGSAAAALISWIVSNKLAKGAQEDFNSELEKAEETLEESRTKTLATAAVAEQYIEKLKELEATGLKTDEQQKEYHNTLVLLTRAVPELAEQIDLQNDKIVGGTEALEKNTEAWVENAKQQAYQSYFNTLYDDYSDKLEVAAEKSISLTEATQKKDEAEEKYQATLNRRQELEAKILDRSQSVTADEINEYMELEAIVYDLEESYNSAADAVKECQAELDEATAVADETKAAIDSKMDSIKEGIGVQRDSTESTEAETEATEDLAQAQKELEDQTRTLSQANELLSSALNEQQASGSLSLDTTLKLIEAGYENALVIDDETSAITLDKNAYISLAKAKIEDQIASVNTQLESAKSKQALWEESYQAAIAGESYITAAEAKELFADASSQVTGLTAQKAALEGLLNKLGDYPVAAASSAGASRSMTTQAEKDAETFNKLQKDLDYQRNIGQLSEKEYYEKLEEYRDKYLTDKSNLDTYRKTTESIYKYNKKVADEVLETEKKLAEKEKKLWKEQTETILDNLEDRMDAVLDKQDELSSKLSEYGDLFEVEDDGRLSLNNLSEQKNVMLEYRDILTTLRDERGISESLLNEIVSMDVETATSYGKQLLQMSEEDFEEYNQSWEEKQKTAQAIAAEFYADEIKAIEKDYNQQLGDALGELKGTAYTSGEETAKSLLEGLASQEEALYTKAKSIADEISRLLSTAYPEKTEVDGSHAGGLPFVPYDGYIAELHQGERVLTAEEAKAYIAWSVPSNISVNHSSVQREETVAAMVNGIAGTMSQIMQSKPSGTVHIQLVLPNGKELASAVYDPLKIIKKQRGE